MVDDEKEQRAPAEIGRDGQEEERLGQEREGALEPTEGVVRGEDEA